MVLIYIKNKKKRSDSDYVFSSSVCILTYNVLFAPPIASSDRGFPASGPLRFSDVI